MLNDKANPASEITDLRSRIVTLESDNAALTRERDAVFNEGLQSIRQLAAAQATNVKLREALKRAGEAEAYASHDDSVGYYVCCQVASYKPHAKGCYIQEALALTADMIERLARQVPPQEVYLVTNCTSSVAFATAEQANKYIGSFSGSVGGGMTMNRIPVIAAGEVKP